MKRLLPALSADLLIENAGHQMRLTGGRMSYVADFPTLSSLFHFARIGWAWRKQIPPGLQLRIVWRGLTLPFRLGRALVAVRD